jgi:SAM-dependent methyltransferase
MSRKYLNDRWCVRCGKTDPTPYLRDHWKKLTPDDWFNDASVLRVLDIGCGNGRNVKFLGSQGFRNTLALDMANDYGFKITLGEDKFPMYDENVEVVLANYVFMFLSPKELNKTVKEIKRVAAPGCTIMVELYPAKDSYVKTEAEMPAFQQELFDQLGWEKVLYSKGRFIARNT